MNQIHGAGSGFINTVEQQEVYLSHVNFVALCLLLVLLVHQHGVTLLEGCFLNSDQMSQHLSLEKLTEQL